jgi:hypothetical protein
MHFYFTLFKTLIQVREALILRLFELTFFELKEVKAQILIKVFEKVSKFDETFKMILSTEFDSHFQTYLIQ